MTEGQFWALIGEAFTSNLSADQEIEMQHFRIKQYLLNVEPAEIKSFHNILYSKLTALCLSKIAEVFLITQPELIPELKEELYISTDAFIDFRAWIVSLGKKHYQTFLNFESEQELLNFNLHPNVAWREDLVYIAQEASQSLGMEPDYDSDGIDRDLSLYKGIELERLREKYPILYERYRQPNFPE